MDVYFSKIKIVQLLLQKESIIVLVNINIFNISSGDIAGNIPSLSYKEKRMTTRV